MAIAATRSFIIRGARAAARMHGRQLGTTILAASTVVTLTILVVCMVRAFQLDSFRSRTVMLTLTALGIFGLLIGDAAIQETMGRPTARQTTSSYIPALVFAVQLLFAIALFAFSPHNAIWRRPTCHQYMCFVIGVMFITALYYALEPTSPQVVSAFGNNAYPLRYLLEPAVAPLTLLALFKGSLSAAASTVSPEERPMWRMTRIRELYRCMLLQYFFMGTAFAATFPTWPSLAFNAGFVGLTWVAFYFNLLTMRGWLQAGASAQDITDEARWAFSMLQPVTTLCAHIHPLAWTLAACGLLSSVQEAVLWCAADACSKTLPMFVLAYFATRGLKQSDKC